MNKNNYLLLSSLLAMSLVGCNNSNIQPSYDSSNSQTVSEIEISKNESEVESSSEEISSVVETPSSEEVSSVENYDFVDYDFDFSKAGGEATTETMSKLPAYTPTTFNASSFSSTTEHLGDGVDMVKGQYKLNNGDTIYPYFIVVDLRKADIVAGCYNNSHDSTDYYKKATPYDSAVSWEKDNPNRKIIATTNADFFGTYPCNAFVKDGIILKNAHHQDPTDYPVSKPMLFGVSKAGARIAPMTNYANYNDNVASSLTDTGMILIGTDGENKGTYLYNKESFLAKNAIGLISTSKTKKSFVAGSKVYKFIKLQKEQCKDGEVRGCLIEEVTEGTSVKNLDPDNYGYICFGPDFDGQTLQVGEYFTTLENTVMSPDGLWNCYDTIIGARHSILEDGQIASTVSQENSNGTAYRVPRTSVGIMPDGKVVILSIEDLHYGGKASTCTGITLTQVADLMRYFGCYDACNFDGGGSSQLVTKSEYNGLGSYVVQTRSSDTGSYTPSESRKVVNSIMVATK